jgi:hypothetical protein
MMRFWRETVLKGRTPPKRENAVHESQRQGAADSMLTVLVVAAIVEEAVATRLR